MAIINHALKELHFNIAYYGPAYAGKTTNLVKIHENIQAAQKGRLVSLATSSDRTFFFDFVPLEEANIRGFKVKFKLYTVPGQVIYNTTRQLVLRGVDGIVFVADSQLSKTTDNTDSFTNMEENLRALKLNLADIPFVFQYNKRDLPDAAAVSNMETILNAREAKMPSFEACANRGIGVLETLETITALSIQKFSKVAK